MCHLFLSKISGVAFDQFDFAMPCFATVSELFVLTCVTVESVELCVSSDTAFRSRCPIRKAGFQLLGMSSVVYLG